MEFVRIKNLKISTDVKQLYEDSFPIEEQVEFEKLFSGVFKEYKMYCIYEKDKLISLVHFRELDKFIHINYLAVKSEYQSKGYGSACLQFLKKLYNKALVIDVEEIDRKALNYRNRIRRIKFYKENGFNEGIYKFMWQGVLMTYMNTESINPEEFMEYIQIVFPTIRDVELK